MPVQSRWFARLAIVSLTAGVAACAHPSSGQSSAHSDLSVLTQQTLNENHFQTAYDAVQSLRSNWLLSKGTDSFQTPTAVRVYLNNTLLGGVETLREIGMPGVIYIRHYDGIQATARWGLGHGAGVIFVSTRADSEPGDRVPSAPPRTPPPSI